MENFINLNTSNIENEHICCAFSDKKCNEGYQLKKQWLLNEFENGYVFRRIDARAKVFIEYGPTESAWVPVLAPNYFMINCFWVSGQYKGKGYAKQLLNDAIEDAQKQNKLGLVTVVGTKKFHFMSDTKWLLKNGFQQIETTQTGFSLLVYKFNTDSYNPKFNETVHSNDIPDNKGLVVYYSNRCPFTDFYVNDSLKSLAEKRGIPLKIIKFENSNQAQSSPSPATIFSLYYNGKFITTDVSVCLETRFDKFI